MVCYRYRKSDKRRLWLICGLLPGLLSPIKINEFIGLTKFCMNRHNPVIHYNDVIMTTMASQITSLMVVYSTVYSDADQRKHQSSASLAFVWGIHRDRWIPRTKGQLRGNVSIWWRHHAFMTKGIRLEADISQMAFPNACFQWKVTYIWYKLHATLFPMIQLTIISTDYANGLTLNGQYFLLSTNI